MKLTLSHADLTLALCEFTAKRGMTAFDPTQVTVDFSFKRGSKELICELDTEPKPQVEAPVAPKAAAAVTASNVAPENAPEAPAPEPEAPVQEPQAPAPEAGAAGDDNLFD